jgi:hypothetical protein
MYIEKKLKCEQFVSPSILTRFIRLFFLLLKVSRELINLLDHFKMSFFIKGTNNNKGQGVKDITAQKKSKYRPEEYYCRVALLVIENRQHILNVRTSVKKRGGETSYEKARRLSNTIDCRYKTLQGADIDLGNIFSKGVVYWYKINSPVVENCTKDIKKKESMIKGAKEIIAEYDASLAIEDDRNKRLEKERCEDAIPGWESELRKLELYKYVLTMGCDPVDKVGYTNEMNKICMTFLKILAGENNTMSARDFYDGICQLMREKAALKTSTVISRTFATEVTGEQQNIQPIQKQEMIEPQQTTDNNSWHRSKQPDNEGWKKVERSHTSKFRDDVEEPVRKDHVHNQQGGKYIPPGARNESKFGGSKFGSDRTDQHGGDKFSRSFDGNTRNQHSRYRYDDNWGDSREHQQSHQKSSNIQSVKKLEDEFPELGCSSVKPKASQNIGVWGIKSEKVIQAPIVHEEHVSDDEEEDPRKGFLTLTSKKTTLTQKRVPVEWDGEDDDYNDHEQGKDYDDYEQDLF